MLQALADKLYSKTYATQITAKSEPMLNIQSMLSVHVPETRPFHAMLKPFLNGVLHQVCPSCSGRP